MGLKTSTLMQIFATLPGLVMNAEEAFSGKPGSGAAKKQFVMDSVAAALNVLAMRDDTEIPAAQQDTIKQVSDGVVENLVSGMKATKPRESP